MSEFTKFLEEKNINEANVKYFAGSVENKSAIWKLDKKGMYSLHKFVKSDKEAKEVVKKLNKE